MLECAFKTPFATERRIVDSSTIVRLELWKDLTTILLKYGRKKMCDTVRLIKKVTTFILILHGLNSTNHIVIYEHFKELQKMNDLPPVPSNLINLFGFYVKMKTNISKSMWENNRFSYTVL